jgi:uncharacterized membrane protein YdbT with pleckstrin-like domain
MIEIGKEQRLGKSTLYLNLVSRVMVPIFLIAVAVASFYLKAEFVESLKGIIGPFAAEVAGTSINWLVVVAAFLMILSIIVSYLQYRFYTFTFEEFDLKLKRGVINQIEVSIPYRQIQDVNVIRSLWYRIFGVSRLVVISAGHGGEKDDQTENVFDPIDKNLGEEIRQALERRIGVQVVQSEEKANIAFNGPSDD